MKHERIFKVLQKIAEASEPVSGAKIAAAIVIKNEIVAVGYNKYKTHPMQRRYAKHEAAVSLHAEIDCIKNALRVIDGDDLQKARMYVLRVKRPDNDHSVFIRAMAKPCCGCHGAVDAFGLKAVYYTTDEGTVEML